MTEEEIEEAKEELEELLEATGMKEPERSFMYDEPYAFRFGGPPDYTLANLHFLKGKSMNHAEGSLELIVENLVKTWEFERSHKLDPSKHKSISQEKFLIGANGWKMFENVEANKVGNYNVLLAGAKEELWAPNQSWEATHHSFKEAFAAFPWEVLKVFSGPPLVGFSWRHWADFTGKYKGNKGNGERLNLYGFATASVNDDLQLETVNIYYNPEEFLEVLEGKKPAAVLEKAKSVFGNYMTYTTDELDFDDGTRPSCPMSGKRGCRPGASCPFSMFGGGASYSSDEEDY